MELSPEVDELVNQWLTLDRDASTRAEIEKLVQSRDFSELNSRLNTRLTFGTAGLRAQMGAGFSRLNNLTIIQTSQGLAEYLLKAVPGASSAGVVIGYDARHNSREFAELAAAAFCRKEIKVWWYEEIVHTPMVPYAVSKLRAAAGVMITASHSPAKDNGYKVYGSNGCQINSPVDANISASILDNLKPLIWEFDPQSSLVVPILTAMRERYLTTIFESLSSSHSLSQNIPRFAYTAMHGVGLRPMQAMLERLNCLEEMSVVEEQAHPNPDFPTVPYPNPEEDGALALAKSTADRVGINLILANDPDADRFAIAEKVGRDWHQFTGDQVGVLLAYHSLEQMRFEVSACDWMLTSAVSSQMLAVIADKEGFSVKETLTGFKWLGNCALEVEASGGRVHFAYEEALGYMFPSVVHDKDGIAAAALFLHACARWHSPFAKLQELYMEFGYFETMNTYWRSSSLEVTAKVFQGMREMEMPFPATVAGRKVLRWRDLTTGYDSSTDDNIPELPSSTSSQMITCWLEGSSNDEGLRFTVRASGTEPKIKIYLECRSKTSETAKRGAADTLKLINQDWFQDPHLQIEDKYAYLNTH